MGKKGGAVVSGPRDYWDNFTSSMGEEFDRQMMLDIKRAKLQQCRNALEHAEPEEHHLLNFLYQLEKDTIDEIGELGGWDG